ncbi:hypothetical protein OCU04_006539 [Sclerotinia nivalis]|uniref:Serine aminopeptidase S33 domain-containing protein n=1 Tax=Sclerotinia nivalis TaxID=352851 RepID=A0A9X0DKL4_9HELO|nr:hypothetical protein OCU04_006539 [Sclerotinia nivalis]
MPFITINGKSIFYTTTPQTENLSNPITTLFIHGLGSSSSFYHTIIPEISTKSTCIAFDTPGSGLSSLGGPPQTVESIIDDAVALLDSLSGTAVMEKVWVVGHSMGGMIACELAIRYSRGVKGLVLLGPIDPSPALSEVFTKRIAAVETHGLEPLADSIPMAATGFKATHTERAFIRSLILGTSIAGYLSLCQVIASAKKPDYAKIHVPIMILAGSEDRTASYKGCLKIHASAGVCAKKKCIQVLPGVGHWHAIEASDTVARDIINFFDKIDDMDCYERSWGK